jgi:hypothetical protein
VISLVNKLLSVSVEFLMLFMAICEILCWDCELVKLASYCGCDKIRMTQVVQTRGHMLLLLCVKSAVANKRNRY